MNYFARTLAGLTSRIRVSDDDGLPVRKIHPGYATVAASQTDQVLGATGAVGDVLDELIIVPATTSPGIVQIQDADGTAITVFTGGATSVADLKPFPVPIGLKAAGETTPGWKVTTGANVSVIAKGKFT